MTGNNKRAAMDWFDRKVLQYVLLWAPAGGMDDEDVFPEFGMRVDQLNERFNSIISTLSGCSSHIDDTDRDCWPAPAVTNCPAVLSMPAHHGSRLIPRHRRDEWRTFEKCAHSANNIRRNCLYTNAFQSTQDVIPRQR